MRACPAFWVPIPSHSEFSQGRCVVGALLEWAATLRERARTALPDGGGAVTYARLAVSTLGEVTLTRPEGSAADRGTKRLIVVSVASALLLSVLAARRVPSLELPGGGWGWYAIGLALVWAGLGLRIWASSLSAASSAAS